MQKGVLIHNHFLLAPNMCVCQLLSYGLNDHQLNVNYYISAHVSIANYDVVKRTN